MPSGIGRCHSATRESPWPWTCRPEPMGADHCGFDAFTHRYRCAQTVWRYADGFMVERQATGAPAKTQHSVAVDGDAVNVGFALDVDSLLLTVRLPESFRSARSSCTRCAWREWSFSSALAIDSSNLCPPRSPETGFIKPALCPSRRKPTAID